MVLDDITRSQERDPYENHLIMRTPWNVRLSPLYPMPLGDRLDGVLLSTDLWHGTIIPATCPLRATSARWSDFCELLSIVSDRLLEIQQSFVKHLTASLEVCTSCGAS